MPGPITTDIVPLALTMATPITAASAARIPKTNHEAVQAAIAHFAEVVGLDPVAAAVIGDLYAHRTAEIAKRRRRRAFTLPEHAEFELHLILSREDAWVPVEPEDAP